MLYLFVGPSCSGKSTAANYLKDGLKARIYSGKDYIRLAKNEPDAWIFFKAKLQEATDGDTNIIYILTEVERFQEVVLIGEMKVFNFRADLSILKQRFSKRTGGVVPLPLENMLKNQVASWENITVQYDIDTGTLSVEEVREKLHEIFQQWIY